mgnify:CR=1 FL=1
MIIFARSLPLTFLSRFYFLHCALFWYRGLEKFQTHVSYYIPLLALAGHCEVIKDTSETKQRLRQNSYQFHLPFSYFSSCSFSSTDWLFLPQFLCIVSDIISKCHPFMIFSLSERLKHRDLICHFFLLNPISLSYVWAKPRFSKRASQNHRNNSFCHIRKFHLKIARRKYSKFYCINKRVN